jgi:phosphoenolpyruvate---glycerone phosphotransferase subunit DhaL
VVTSADVSAVFRELLAVIEREQASLDRLDAVVGDGDHGATMVLGLRAVVAALPEDGDERTPDLLRLAAMRFASVGGSTGPLWGTALLRAAQSLDAAPAADLAAFAAAAGAAADGIASRGRCQEGDKTVLDVMAPAARALDEAAAAGLAPAEALPKAVEAARAALERTRDLEPKRGRARRAADRSRGHVDPGGASAVLVWETLARQVDPRRAAQDQSRAGS